MPAMLDLRRLTTPVVQAGMGAIARHELAAYARLSMPAQSRPWWARGS
jgi:hypothetical protein